LGDWRRIRPVKNCHRKVAVGRSGLIYRVSTTSGNPEATGNLLKFNWSFWKFLSDDNKGFQS